MTARNFHYLKTLPAGHRPARFITLGVALCPTNAKRRNDSKKTLECAAWSASELIDYPAGYAIERYAVGSKGTGALNWIVKQLQKGICIDCWCIDALPVVHAIGLWEAIDKGKWILRDGTWTGSAVLSDPPVIITVRPERVHGVLRILDLRNLGIRTVGDLREATDASYLCSQDWPSNGWNATVCAAAIDDAIGEYIGKWYALLEKENLGSPKPTLAGQAWCAYRTRFIDSPILCHANVTALNLESSAIFQGRTECFRLGKIEGPIYHLDYQSHYASLCLNESFPARLKHFVDRGYIEPEKWMRDGWLVIAECEITSGQNSYPCNYNGMQVFPVGKYSTTLCGNELTEALAMGHVDKVVRLAAYEPENLLDGWATWCLGKRFDAKAKNDRVGEYVIKMITNGLWGRWAKRELRWKSNDYASSGERWGDWYDRDDNETTISHYRTIGGMGQRFSDEGYGKDACPAVYAWLTSLGRYDLWQTMIACKPGKVYYCATDSLLCDRAAYESLCAQHYVCDGEPGKLKLHNIYGWVNIKGIHHYETSSGRVTAGVPDGATGSEKDGFSWSSTEGITGQLRRHERPSALIVPKARTASGHYRHGIVGKDGRCYPIVLPEE